MSNIYDPEVEAGFKMWYGDNVSRYPIENAYSLPEFYRSVKRDFDSYKSAFETQPNKSAFSEYKLAGNNDVPSPSAKSPVQERSNSILPEDSWNELKNFIGDQEKLIPYPYLDKFGGVTSCEGNLDESYDEFESHPWLDKTTGKPATSEQKRESWKNLTKQPKNHKAQYYESKTNLEINPAYCNSLLNQNIQIRDAELKRGFPNYSKMSQSMKNALHDVHYTSNVLNFKEAKNAARQMNKEDFCKQLHRSESGRPDMKDRNDWVYQQCMKGQFNK